MMRLDKLVGELNIASRSQAKLLIRKGKISVDGIVIRNPEIKVDEASAILTHENVDYKYKKFHYFLLNKPEGYVSATEDNKYDTVIDLFNKKTGGKYKNGFFPVGRLDIDTVGLMLITDDGKLAHTLLSPKYHVPKTYHVVSLHPIDINQIEMLSNPLDLGDFVTKPAIVDKICENECNITITEGKFHQVKRMFEAVGNKVIYLKRISFGPLILEDNHKEGEIRELTLDEERILKNIAGETDV